MIPVQTEELYPERLSGMETPSRDGIAHRSLLAAEMASQDCEGELSPS
jgi:hypothetical protein